MGGIGLPPKLDCSKQRKDDCKNQNVIKRNRVNILLPMNEFEELKVNERRDALK